jgi:predicted enzyme related to lactoylglutathione lyase
MSMSDPGKIGAVLYAKDVVQVSSFYAGVLGLEVADSQADRTVLESPTFQLVVHAIPEDIARSIEVAIPPIRRTDTPIKLVFYVENISATRIAAARLGGELNSPESEWEFQGDRICDGHDPEGNVLQFREKRH